MLLNAALCLPGVDTGHSNSYRLGILGFDQRSRDYVARALVADKEIDAKLEIVVFVSPGSDDWTAARSLVSENRNMKICTSMVTAILPTDDDPQFDIQFIVETAQGPYPVNDLFLSRSGGAISTRSNENEFQT